MKKLKLLLATCALLLGTGQTWAQTDVTSTYITNADFEGEYSSYAQPKSDRDIYQPTGWTVEYKDGDTNDLTSLNSSTTQWNNFSSRPKPTDGGNNTYWIRYRWGDKSKLTLSQKVTLPAGAYTLSADAFFNGASKASAKISAAGQNQSITGNSTWANYKINFTLDSETEVTISFNLTQGEQREVIAGFDNFVLMYTDFKAELRAVIAQAQAINARISTLGDAINTAQGVLDNASASKSAIDGAVSTLRSAISEKLAAYTGLNAAGDDITSFIVNNGFETSPIFDGTSLGSSDPKSNATPTAGSTLLYNAKNVYQINGWELLTTETSDFARTFTMPYDKTLYVVSNNAVAGQAVTSPTNGSSVTESNGDLLFVEANWCENAVLGVKQTIPLPAGSYRLTFDSYVTNAIGNKESRCGVSYGETTNYKWPEALNTWTANEVDFTLDVQTDVTISMGYKKIGNVGGGNSAFLFVDNVKLTYFDPVKLAQIQWQETWDALDALDEDALPGAAKKAITDALGAEEPDNVEGYNTAKEALQALIDSYDGIKAAYDKVKALIVFATAEKDNSTGDNTTFTTAINTATTTIETRETADDLTSDYNILETARQTYVTSGAQPTTGHVFDYTFKIPDAAVTSASDWSSKRLNSGQQYTGAPDNTYFDIYDGNRNIQKNIGTLRLGKYELKAATRSEASVTVGNIYVSQNAANLNQTNIHHDGNTGGDLGNGWSWTTVAFDNYVDDKDITLGFYSECGSSKWAGADDFHLYYKGNVVDDETAEALKETFVDGKMNATVQSTQESALDAFKSDQTFENYNALKTAIAAASASKSAYTEANTKLTAMKTVVDATNVYTEAALNEYYTTPKSKYDEGTLTNEEAAALQDPTATTGVRAAITVDNFLLSAWNTEPDFTAANSPYYINSWSQEGKNDGSGMTTPFYEYWVSNSSTAKLDERTLTATLSDVPAGNYYIDVLVRVSKNTGDNPTPYGITLDVNGGTSVDVCAGNQIGSTTYYYDTFRALGTVAADGILTINFNVAEDNNISWLAFKNVTYAVFNGATKEQKAALASAIETAEGKTLGFLKDEYAPYNNVDALEKLAIAKAIDTETATASEVITATNNLSEATWTSNATDVDIIYNGNFAIANGTNPKGWTRSNGAWGQQITGLTPETNDVNEGTTTGWYYNTEGAWEYGKDDIYKMPLPASTSYKLTFKYRSHANGSNNYMKASVLNDSDEGLAEVTFAKNGDMTKFVTATAYFTTGAAGNYVLSLTQSGNTHLTDVSLEAAPATISENETYDPKNRTYYETVTLARTIKADTWNTFCVPFDLSNDELKTAFGNDVAVAEFSDSGESADDVTVSFDKMDTPAITANTPVLLKGNAGTSFTFNGKLIKTGDAKVVGTYFDFVGSYDDSFEIPEGDYYISQNKLWKSKGSGSYIMGTRAYLEAKVAAARVVNFFIDDQTTSIDETLSVKSEATANAPIYNLNGQKMDKQSLRKGLYIQNGKKVVRK